ncbi:T9SS type A sorting domain-containing protein [Aquirufa sp. ROCK2-A2]
MKKSLIFSLFIILPFLSLGQKKTAIQASFLKFPNNMADWMKTHISNLNRYNEPLGTKFETGQSKQFYDFNKDGKKDICMEIGLNYFLPPNKEDSAYMYFKGIFVNKGNETFELDTNYIISGRGRPWYGKFGDFNGDGKIDYFHLTENYHGDQAKKPLDLFRFKDIPDGSPSHVFFNNGTSFDRIDLDTLHMISQNGYVIDINDDGKDEIISIPQGKFIVYSYNTNTKKFDQSFDHINQIIRQKYGNTIKFFNFENVENKKIKLTISYDFTTGDKNNWKVDIAEIGLKDSTFTVINSFKHPVYLSPNGTLANADIQANDSFKYTDLNGDGIKELIMISPYSMVPEMQGFNIIENNQLVTSKYWTPDLNEVGFRIQGFIQDLNGDNKLDIVSSEWNLDRRQNYLNYYYEFKNGRFLQTKLDLTSNSLIPPNIPYWTWVEDFNEDGSNDIFVFNERNMLESYYYKTIDCDKTSKPILSSNKNTFCANDSLKVSISNTLKGDKYKWYYGSKIDSTNSSSKYFTEAYQVFVVKMDSLGCVKRSDTLIINKLPLIQAPSISNSTPLIFCSGQNVVLTSSSTNNQWFLNGSPLINATSASYTANATGTYQVKALNGDCSSSLSSGVSVVVNAIPSAPSIIMESNGGLTSSASNGNQWYFNSNIIENATQKTINPTKSGNYTVKVTTPCSSEMSKPYNLVISALEENILSQIQLAPNPFSSQLKVSFPHEFGKFAHLQIMDMTGNLQLQKAIVFDGELLDLSILKEGNYLLILMSNENANSTSMKITKVQ